MGYLWTVNLGVALSNVAGFTLAHYARCGWTSKMIMLLASTCSTLMHLSEVKHGLPGIRPFNRMANSFLWLDRMAAVGSVCYVLLSRPACVTQAATMSVGLGGLMCLWLSERIENGPIWFASWHTLWHFAAYTTMYLALSE